ncbi:MAG: efflux RND transporter periplasmic adaptor subunit [Caulobacter sp.]|nr:efflux RND transporter periplasmic adaptor subunit [Caulobacter sp.]
MTSFLRSAGALALALTLTACGGPSHETAAPGVPAKGERLTVQKATVTDYKPVAASVTTRDMGEARARIGGTLVRLNVREGAYVRKGQVLAVITDQRLTYETSAYDAQVAAAAAEATRAQADLGRIRTLFDKGIYAQARLDQAQAGAKAAQAALTAARAQRAASSEMSRQGAVLAPATGRVLKADVPAGSVVTPGQLIATVTAGPLLLRIEVPESQARALRTGDTVAIDQRDLPAAPATGVIAQLYPAITAGRVTADITVPGLTDDLIGQRVRVRIKAGERQAVTLPKRFVATRFGVDYVRLVDKSGQAVEVAVQLSPGADANHVEVLSGLVAGDVIVAPGAGS